MREQIIEAIRENRLIVILRGVEKNKLIPLCEAMYRGGVRLAELTYSATKSIPDEENAARIKMLAEHFACGIGVGESAFSQIYPLYSYIGTEITAHSHSLYIEIAVELGIIGLLIFLGVMFMVVQRGFGCIKYNFAAGSVIKGVSAAMAGILAVLVHGAFDYVWYNYRVFFMFWVVVGVLCAFDNTYPRKSYDNTVHYDIDKEASLDIIFGQKNDAVN